MNMTRPHPRRGFTLVEVLVVIAIIVILVGTVVAIGTQVRANAQRNTTKTTLKGLEAMLDVFKKETGAEPLAGTSDFVTKFTAYPNTKKVLDKLPAGTVSSGNVLDGFGNPITFVPTNTSTGTAAYFQSAGPDGDQSSVGDNIKSTDP